MQYPKQKVSGFTIIELLIVIVIIGILAGLAFNAIANAQQRARNAALLRIVKQYETALLAHKADTGSYPPFSDGNGGTCVGTGYEDRNGNGQGDCNLFSVDFESDSTFNDALKPYFSNELPPAGNYEVDLGTDDPWQGLIFVYEPDLTVGGQDASDFFVAYLLEGTDQDCARTVVTPASGFPDYTEMNPRNSGSIGEATGCVFLMPD